MPELNATLFFVDVKKGVDGVQHILETITGILAFFVVFRRDLNFNNKLRVRIEDEMIEGSDLVRSEIPTDASSGQSSLFYI